MSMSLWFTCHLVFQRPAPIWLYCVLLFPNIKYNFAKISLWNQISAMNTIISFSFCFSEHVPRSSSMDMSAMRAPMVRHHLKTQCMTPTWNLLRLRQFDSIPHWIQSALWYSPTNWPLLTQWFSPHSLLQSTVWFQRRKNKLRIRTRHREQSVL